MISVPAIPAADITRCTLGYAWQLARHVHHYGWCPGTELLLDHLAARIVTWHTTGISGEWS